MVATITAGNSLYCVAIATAQTGATGSEVPDGTVIYVFPQEVDIFDKNNDKRRVIANNKAIKNLTNKLDLMVIMKNVEVHKVVKNTATEELDYIRDFIHDYGSVGGAAKVYCFVWNRAEAKAIKLSWDTSGNQLNYMEGRPVPTTWNMGKDVVKGYKASSFIFEQVNLG
jgi:hypothetical protein